mmetsp:Transcript_87943/g.283977  ORF Transcript_87943/g.283977 Transcript_87943/m.283977 type:complete len:810 (-) Transcript_87943:133-2562(-)
MIVDATTHIEAVQYGGTTCMATPTDEEKVQVGPGCLWSSFAAPLVGQAAAVASTLPGVLVGAAVAGARGSGQGSAPPGGSFWQIFDQMDFGGPCPIDLMLEQKDCPVELLLAESDLLQELRTRHSGLVARLTRPDGLLALIDLITRQPPVGASQSRKFGVPFAASQVLTSDVHEIFQAWVSPEHPEILDRFWAYLEESPADRVDAVLSGYFSGAAAALLDRQPEEVTSYLRIRGPSALLDALLQRLHARSMAELLACIACVEWPSRRVFRTDELLRRLLAVMQDSSAMEDSQELKGGSMCFAEELLGLVTSPDVVDPLMDLVLHAEHRRATAAAMVLTNAVCQVWGGGATSSGGRSPLRGGSLSPPGLGGPAGSSPSRDGEAEDVREVPMVLRDSSSRSMPVTVPPEHCKQLVASVCVHVAGIRTLFEGALEAGLVGPGASSSTRRTSGWEAASSKGAFAGRPVPVVSLGNVLEVILLLVMLVRAHRETALQALHHAELLPLCLRVLVAHPWSSLIHNAVCELFKEVLSEADTFATALFFTFASPGDVLEMIVEQYRQRQRLHDGARPGRSPAVGFMGQLHTLCVGLVRFSHQGASERQRVCGGLLAAAPGWSDVVMPMVTDVSRIHNDVDLGGGIPADIRALTTSGGDWSSLQLGAGGGYDGGGYGGEGPKHTAVGQMLDLPVAPTLPAEEGDPNEIFSLDVADDLARGGLGSLSSLGGGASPSVAAAVAAAARASKADEATDTQPLELRLVSAALPVPPLSATGGGWCAGDSSGQCGAADEREAEKGPKVAMTAAPVVQDKACCTIH